MFGEGLWASAICLVHSLAVTCVTKERALPSHTKPHSTTCPSTRAFVHIEQGRPACETPNGERQKQPNQEPYTKKEMIQYTNHQLKPRQILAGRAQS